MLHITNTLTPGKEEIQAVIRGMRNPMNSWDKSDTDADAIDIGDKDFKLMVKLGDEGSCCRKFMRMMNVYADVTAPLYWWKEYDTYKVGTVANSCSTMHRIAEKEFTIEDFSTEHLFDENDLPSPEERFDIDVAHCEALAAMDVDGELCYYTPKYFINMTCNVLNCFRELFLKTKDKKYWWQMIQLLPSSYNQKRTIMLNYEVLRQMYKWRRNHKLDEWHTFCDWIETLPYSYQLICCKEGSS